MGCDIHFVVEKKINGRWIGIFKEYPRSGFVKDRDYDFFAAIAGVRGSHPLFNNHPRFIPADISELSLYAIAEGSTDDHSHSWMTIKEFSEIALTVNPDRFVTEWDKKEPWEPLFGRPLFLNRSADRIEDYRIIFWFDN